MMVKDYLSIREVVEPIMGGYWGGSVEQGTGNARVVRNGDILESGEINQKVPERQLTEKEIERARLRVGDILITMSGNVGRVARARTEKDDMGKPYVASNFVKILRTKTGILPEYLFFFLKGSQFENELKKYTRGVAIQNLSVKVFDQNFIPKISIKEQEQIVALLEETEELKKKRATADQKMTAIIPTLFSQIFGSLSTNKRGWPNVRLGDYVKVAGGFAFKSSDYRKDGVPLIRIGNILSGGGITLDGCVFLPRSFLNKFKKYQLKGGDILMGLSGATTGKTGIAKEDMLPALLNQRVGKCEIVDHQGMNTQFLFAFLTSQYYQDALWRFAIGGAQPNVSPQQLESIQFPLPQKELQDEFAEKVKDIQLLSSGQRKSTTSIDKLLSSVLSRVFTS